MMADSDADSDLHWLKVRLKDSLQRADKLIQACSARLDLTGMRRFRKKCIAEQCFLQRLEEDLSHVRAANLTSSNLLHLESTVSLLNHLPMVVEIQKSLRLASRSQPIHVDIVCNCGYTWAKVIARNTKALEMDVAGCLEYGEKSLISHAQDLIELSQIHPLNFINPLVVFVFTNAIPQSLRTQLSQLGIKVVAADDLVSGSLMGSDLLPEVSLTIDKGSNGVPIKFLEGSKKKFHRNLASTTESKTDRATKHNTERRMLNQYISKSGEDVDVVKECEVVDETRIRNEHQSDASQEHDSYDNLRFYECSKISNLPVKWDSDIANNSIDRNEVGNRDRGEVNNVGDSIVGQSAADNGLRAEENVSKTSCLLKCNEMKQADCDIQTLYTLKTKTDLCLLNENKCSVVVSQHVLSHIVNPNSSLYTQNVNKYTIGLDVNPPIDVVPSGREAHDSFNTPCSVFCLEKDVQSHSSQSTPSFSEVCTATNVWSDNNMLSTESNSKLCSDSNGQFYNCSNNTSSRIIEELKIIRTLKPVMIKVNLDVTSMIVLISNLCHGMNNFIFSDDILTQQATEERSSPALPPLLDFITGKHLLSCTTALQDFQSILKTIGGKEEKRRAEILLNVVEPIADKPSSRAMSLKTSSRIKMRSKIVFGTGDSVEAVTVTANEGFVRAVRQFGFEFSVFVHPARALTEQKQANATQLSKSLM